ncbi:MAG TPA: phosphoribosyltransferase [Terriglobales bacterium]|nr:phosphoribosyltransferase [Terriglobales bacterium]
MIFRDRTDAGRQLAEALKPLTGRPDVLVLALPRGGVPVAYAVAEALGEPLDVFLVRKLGMPGQPELAMGAVASNGSRVLNQDVLRQFDIPEAVIEAVTRDELRELERRDALFRGNRPHLEVAGKTVVLVDDGLATGSTMRAAARALLQQHPARLIIAVPVAATQTCEELQREFRDLVCLYTPEPFYAVGQWYQDFNQTSDDEVRELLERARRPEKMAS